MPHSDREIHEDIEREKADKRSRGERVTGMASVRFSQASVTAKEHDKYARNIPAAASMAKTKRAKTTEQQDESPAPDPAKSARIETALPSLTIALAKAG